MIHAGFDIGGTRIRLLLYDEDFEEVASAQGSAREHLAPGAMASALGELLGEAFEASGRAPDELASVGAGIAGQLDARGEVVRNAPNLGWRDEPFAERVREELEATYGAPHVRLVNDLDAQLWGEHLAGAVEGVDDVVAAYVGTGVGGAILTGGRLVAGHGGAAGEVGHVKVEPGGRLCGCGERGCLEAYAGGVHLERMVAEYAHMRGLDAIFARDEEGRIDRDRVDLGAVDERVDDDAQLAAIWERATDHLAVSLANLCTVLDPAVLLLGGGVVLGAQRYREMLEDKLLPLVLEVVRDGLEIRFAAMPDTGGMLGAARLARP
jgi:glucokinase